MLGQAITIQKLNPTDKTLINQIAQWYLSEWAIPIDTTIHRLTNVSNDDVLFQLVLSKNNIPVATGGLYNKVGLLKEHERFQKFKPWVALLYTDTNNRNQGIGQLLLNKIEDAAKETGLKKIYLFTFTAESLYIRADWKDMERVNYRGHDTVVMEKYI